ncbi:hypothetical protein DMENIID0001_113980 [Sergentomyia squamirostris]
MEESSSKRISRWKWRKVHQMATIVNWAVAVLLLLFTVSVHGQFVSTETAPGQTGVFRKCGVETFSRGGNNYSGADNSIAVNVGAPTPRLLRRDALNHVKQ